MKMGHLEKFFDQEVDVFVGNHSFRGLLKKNVQPDHPMVVLEER
jgi:hypothetical protein